MIDLFGKKKLEKEIQVLKEALQDCQSKMSEKQLQINKTNAYWKNKLRALKYSQNNKK